MQFTSRFEFGNKFQYLQCKLSLTSLLQNIHHDAVSGWLMLASFFYGRHQYQKALKVIRYSLSKCTLEKMIFLSKLFSQT